MQSNLVWRTAVALGAVLALIGAGCDRRDDAAEIAEHNRELAAEQAAETAEQHQEAAERHAELTDEASENVDEAVGEAREQREEVAEAQGALAMHVATACESVPEAQRGQCPVEAADVRSVERDGDDITLHLATLDDAEEALEDRVRCYRAVRAAAAANPAQLAGSACIFDDPEMDIDVDDEDGKLAIEIDVDEERAPGLFERANTLYHRAPTAAEASR